MYYISVHFITLRMRSKCFDVILLFINENVPEISYIFLVAKFYTAHMIIIFELKILAAKHRNIQGGNIVK